MARAEVVHVKRDAERIAEARAAGNYVYIGRNKNRLGWGNPYSHRPGAGVIEIVPTVEQAISRYRVDLWRRIRSGDIDIRVLAKLHGKVLGCWCKPGPCHGTVLAAAAEWAAEEMRQVRSRSSESAPAQSPEGAESSPPDRS